DPSLTIRRRYFWTRAGQLSVLRRVGITHWSSEMTGRHCPPDPRQSASTHPTAHAAARLAMRAPGLAPEDGPTILRLARRVSWIDHLASRSPESGKNPQFPRIFLDFPRGRSVDSTHLADLGETIDGSVGFDSPLVSHLGTKEGFREVAPLG